MRALLDTHAFLWLINEPERLPQLATDILKDGDNEIFLSTASVWEISIKHALGRELTLPEPPERYLPPRIHVLGLRGLAIQFDHAFRVAHLPPIHRDPFDRLLIAQAQVEGLPIITSDPNIARYDVEVIW